MKLQKIFLACCVILIAAACRKPIPIPNPGNPTRTDWTNKIDSLKQYNRQKISIQQGLAGTLIMKEGDCMPMINPATTTCKHYPVKRTICIYPYTKIQSFAGLDDIIMPNAPVARVETDDEGFFQYPLANGTYSVLVEEKGKLYCKNTDGYGGLNPVTVNSIVANVDCSIDYSVN